MKEDKITELEARSTEIIVNRKINSFKIQTDPQTVVG